MEKQVQKQRSILKDLNTAFLVLNPKKSLILSVEEDLGLIFYTKKLLVFSAALCVLCGENDLGFGSSHKKKIFVFSVALCDLCGENVLEVGFPNKNSF